MQRPGSRTLDIAINAALLSAAAFVLVLPGSPLRKLVDEWQDERRSEKLVDEHWEDLLFNLIDTSAYQRESVVVAFVDYQCAACAAAHADLTAARANGVDIAVVYRHFPLTRIHPNSEGAARAAICAEAQRMLSEMNEVLYRTSGWHERGDWLSLAEGAGIPDLTAFDACTASEETRLRLREDMRWAETLEVRATPTFIFHNGKEVGYVRGGRWARLLARDGVVDES
jgi:protein-disulfide isomerase